ncbi:hypothetical protein [Pontibacter sp. G13]|uniref:hypothetical protein n=1 Tax=Pontibacter sp. G13 TaxID=3074898 RepID=UPI00288B96B6|nr:hypothetical protein [Pontibacter sp. G13]WNJ17149.1 hypothetical protein RJD25_20020 [Pontibacter sp. G13]
MFRNLFSKKVKEVMPDKPLGFGYKNKWIALKTDDRDKVVKFLNLKKVQKSNWKDGVKFGYEEGVFITPDINGWTLALGVDISDLESEDSQEFLKRASTEFEECQIFQTHRIVEYHFWGKAKNGHIERLYSYVGESGENLINEGKPTEIENTYNLVNTFSKESESDDYWEREDLDIPDEQIVMEIAENWSIDPTKIEEIKGLEGIGLIGK